jgi:hypothetical protein
MSIKVAVVTMCKNESEFLPIWLNYYGGLFGFENLYIIDDDSSDGSTQDSRIVNVVRRRKTPFDDGMRAIFISLIQHELLKNYELVI